VVITINERRRIMNRQIIAAALLLAGLLALTVSGHSQDKYFGKAGTIELSGSISFSSFTPVSDGETSDATTLFSLGPEIGYFIIDGLEVGVNSGISLLPGISVVTPSEGEGTTILQLFFFPAYNIHTEGGQVTPFLQVPIGYTSLSSGNITDSGFSWGIKGGIKIVAAGHFLVNVYAQYMQLSFTPENANERSGFNYFSFGVALGGFF
jgi:hypothetical protein